MRFLVTGGAGFIGSHLAERLIVEGHTVTVLDDLSTGSLENLRAIERHPRLEFVEGTVLNRRLVHECARAADFVVHLAAAVGVRRVLERPLESLKTNVDGSENVLEACAAFKHPLLLASTSETYGKNSAAELCEDSDSVLGASSVSRWSYAAAKKLDEFLGLAYHTTFGLPVTITRFFNIVGPRQSARYGMVLPAFVRAALAGEPIRVFGDGRQSRNFTYIDDCIDALLRLLGCPLASGKIVNIGGPEEVTILRLAERVRAAAGSNSDIVLVPYHEAYPEGGYEDMRRRVPCTCRLQALTGWRPATSLDATIENMIAYERGRARQDGPPSGSGLTPHAPALVRS
jgi:UDP-glucose 4-epimerase